jgi:hypothetical protein
LELHFSDTLATTTELRRNHVRRHHVSATIRPGGDCRQRDAGLGTRCSGADGPAGIPYLPAPKPDVIAVSDNADPTESRLCIRAGLGVSVPMMAGPQLTVEHGLFGCPTNTGGLPIVVVQDPALQPPPDSRAGDYNLNVTVRYRLVQLSHLQVVASASDQGVGYSLNSPVSGNNLLLAVSLIF